MIGALIVVSILAVYSKGAGRGPEDGRRH